MTVHDLPAVNASLNGLSAMFLTLGFVFIRRGNKIAHRNCMISAFVTSIFFLGCYLTYHGYLAMVLHQGPTRFQNPEWFRPIYLTILLTHTVLAVVIVPLILITLWRAKTERFDLHKKNCALDVATLDVCLRDRRAGLPAALSDFPAALRWSPSFSLSGGTTEWRQTEAWTPTKPVGRDLSWLVI